MLVCRKPVIEKHRQNGKFLYMCLHTTGTNNRPCLLNGGDTQKNGPPPFLLCFWAGP